MLTKEEAKQIHGTEIFYKVPWMKRGYNCIALCSPENGLSIKLLPKTYEELREFVEELMEAYKQTYEETLAEVTAPHFCICKGGTEVPFESLLEVIANGTTSGSPYEATDDPLRGNPVCPFYN